MTTTAAALPSLVDALVAEPLDGASPAALQARIAAVAPQVARLQGWLQAAAGRLDHVSGGHVEADEHGHARTVAGWLADVQHATPTAAGSLLRTARLLRSMPLVAQAVLDGALTPG